MNSVGRKSRLLRGALRANGAFSLLSGLVLIGAARPLAALFGLAGPAALLVVGVSLLFYAASLVRNAAREPINRSEALLAVILDAAWVVASAVLIFAGVLSAAGNWAVAAVADVVLLFGVLQYVGLRRLRPGE
jgi:hypothetical protein